MYTYRIARNLAADRFEPQMSCFNAPALSAGALKHDINRVHVLGLALGLSSNNRIKQFPVLLYPCLFRASKIRSEPRISRHGAMVRAGSSGTLRHVSGHLTVAWCFLFNNVNSHYSCSYLLDFRDSSNLLDVMMCHSFTTFTNFVSH